ncbi:hypothetical protein D3C87_2156890 [compost metagenome]
MLEDVLPYPPFLIGVGERRDALGLKLLDGLVKLCSCFWRRRNPSIREQLFVINQREQVAFHRQSKHFAITG